VKRLEASLLEAHAPADPALMKDFLSVNDASHGINMNLATGGNYCLTKLFSRMSLSTEKPFRNWKPPSSELPR
jgi:hypothetical protein